MLQLSGRQLALSMRAPVDSVFMIGKVEEQRNVLNVANMCLAPNTYLPTNTKDAWLDSLDAILNDTDSALDVQELASRETVDRQYAQSVLYRGVMDAFAPQRGIFENVTGQTSECSKFSSLRISCETCALVETFLR